MQPFPDILKNSRIFSGLSDSDITKTLDCFQPRTVSCPKGAFLYQDGDLLTEIGIVLEGNIHILQEDFWGNRSILAEITPGHIFGESYSCSGLPLTVSIFAPQNSKIMFLKTDRILYACQNACHAHHQMLNNLITVLAAKNRMLTQKISHISKRTIREKLLAYLSEEAKRQGKPEFSIPFNRQQLADYLSIDRSALSRELSSMEEEGLIEFHKNHFKLMP